MGHIVTFHYRCSTFFAALLGCSLISWVQLLPSKPWAGVIMWGFFFFLIFFYPWVHVVTVPPTATMDALQCQGVVPNRCAKWSIFVMCDSLTIPIVSFLVCVIDSCQKTATWHIKCAVCSGVVCIKQLFSASHNWSKTQQCNFFVSYQDGKRWYVRMSWLHFSGSGNYLM